MKKLSKSLAALAAASVFSVGIMFAASGDSKVAGCCTKAKDAGKTCSHACCVEAAKAGNNCTKCGGAGKIEQSAPSKK
jgi:hypothetical protein